jgi:hypothetical protein
MGDFKEAISAQVRLEQSKVKPYQGIVFLCGGTTDVRSPKPSSIRDAIYRELAKISAIECRIKLAEDYKDWANDSVYRDLVTFERHLAELSSLIVLVLESPGSIAELGLFSAIEEFREKLLVFIDSGHYNASSFIRLGPIDYLEKSFNNLAECHAWIGRERGKERFDENAAEKLQADLADAVTTRLDNPAKEQPFDPERWLHVALLICDLINLFSALSIREVRECLLGLGVKKEESEVRQALFLLQKIGLIVMEPKGMQRFYVAADEHQFIKLHLETPTYDLDRFRSDVLADYRKNDKKRFSAIQAVRERAGA